MLWPKPTVEAGRATHMAPPPSAGQSAKKKGSTLRRDGYAGCCPSALARRKGGLWSPADQRKRGPHRPSALFFFSCALLLRPSPAGLWSRRRGEQLFRDRRPAAQRSSHPPEPEPESDVGSTAAAILSLPPGRPPPPCRPCLPSAARDVGGKLSRRADVAQGRQGAGWLAGSAMAVLIAD